MQTVGTYTPVPFCRAGHPLTTVPPQGIKVLREYPIISTEMPRWYGHRLETMPHDPELADEIAERGRSVRVASVATMEALVTRTNSLGLAPREAIERGIDAGQLAVLAVPDDQRVLLAPAPIVVVFLKERALPPSAIAVIDQIRRAVTADAGTEPGVPGHSSGAERPILPVRAR